MVYPVYYNYHLESYIVMISKSSKKEKRKMGKWKKVVFSFDRDA
jgi:hypothetical protein